MSTPNPTYLFESKRRQLFLLAKAVRQVIDAEFPQGMTLTEFRYFDECLQDQFATLPTPTQEKAK